MHAPGRIEESPQAGAFLEADAVQTIPANEPGRIEAGSEALFAQHPRQRGVEPGEPRRAALKRVVKRILLLLMTDPGEPSRAALKQLQASRLVISRESC